MHELILSQVKAGAGSGMWKRTLVRKEGKTLELLAVSPPDVFWKTRNQAIQAFKDMIKVSWGSYVGGYLE